MKPWRTSAPGWSVLALAMAIAATLGGAVGGLASRLHDEPPAGPRAQVNIGGVALPLPAVRRDGTSVAAVAARILPSVVSIEVRVGSGGDTGSGIVISDAGYILTNNHVVAAAATGGKLSVVFPDKRSVPGAIVGRDVVSDLAVVQVHGVTGLQPAAFGSSAALAVGDPVLAVGSPLGLAGSVTSGIVSALDRPVAAGDSSGSGANEVIDAIQTDAAINPGNSGGPLVDMAGRVIGINSAIATLSSGSPFGGGGQGGSIGLGFAIPIDQAKRIARQLIELGYSTHAVIGVRLDPAYHGDGARIAGLGGTAVEPGGPADRAGLRDGDVVVVVDGVRVTSGEELVALLRKHQPGDRVSLTYSRDGQRHTVSLVLGSARSD